MFLYLKDNQRVNFMAYTWGWDLILSRFKIKVLKAYWVRAPQWGGIPSVLLVFVWRPFFLIAFKFDLRCVVFNSIKAICSITFYYSFIYSFILS